MQFTRRETLVLAAAASAISLCGVASASAAEGAMVDMAKLMAPAIPDKILGSAEAPVTVIEYASPTCPHCAAFHNNVFEGFKTTYVDSGKVQFILRPFVRNVLDAAVFMLAEASGETNYNNVISTYFRTQQTWGASDKPRDAILEIAKQLGFTQETFDAALSNQELFTGMETMREQALNELGLEGTPTFYINGKTLSGDKTMEQLAAEIDPLVPSDFVAATTPAAPATETPVIAPPAMAPSAGAMAPVAPAGETMTPVK